MRCFIAIALPAEIRERLSRLPGQLHLPDRAVRWTRPEQIHLTMKFLGEVPDDRIPAICEAAADLARRFEPFAVDVSGTGCFPPSGSAQIVWVGLKDTASTLADCQRAFEDRYEALGFPRENRPFRPHLTIGRVRDPRHSSAIRAALAEHGTFTAGQWIIDELIVFQSILDRSGPTHIPLSRAKWGGPA